jgi:hypothetical protein
MPPSDRSADDPLDPCGRCPNCLAGMRHACLRAETATPVATLATEAASMIDYLAHVIEHDIPPPEYVDDAERAGAFYLQDEVRKARQIAAGLRRESEPHPYTAGCPETCASREALTEHLAQCPGRERATPDAYDGDSCVTCGWRPERNWRLAAEEQAVMTMEYMARQTRWAEMAAAVRREVERWRDGTAHPDNTMFAIAEAIEHYDEGER